MAVEDLKIMYLGSLRPFSDGDLSMNNLMVVINQVSKVPEQLLSESNGLRWWSL